jgi:DNA replication protein DnaD
LQIWAFFIGDNMEYNKGYIAIHRVIRTHWLWDKNRVFSDFEAWLDLIMFARWEKEPTKQRIGNKLYTVGRGEQIRSIKTLSKTWNWSASKTRRFLVLLESDGMIALKSDSQTTHVTICNYDTYQKERIADESQVNRIRIASEFQVNTIEERKEREVLTRLFG